MKAHLKLAAGRSRKTAWLLVAAVFFASPAGAQETPSISSSSGVHAAALEGSAKTGQAGARVMNPLTESTWIKHIEMEKGEISLVSGRSHLLRLQRKIARISISNPDILDAVIISPMEVLLNAKTEGSANIIMWDLVGEATVLDIMVTKNPGMLHSLLRSISPDSSFEIYPSSEVFVVRGEVDTVAKQRAVERAANAFAEGSVSLVTVREAKQVLLKIRFVELDRSKKLNFGVDMEYDRNYDRSIMTHRLLPGGTNARTSGDSTGFFSNPASQLQFDIFDRNDRDVYQFQRFGNSSVLQGFLKAIETEGVGKIIARPNLLASDGEEASFLVGGEAAVVAISADSVGVEYREFGTRLTFTPQIRADGRIRLTVVPEVSSLDFANGVTVNNVIIPSFTTVRTRTVVELGDGETLMIGGLLQQKLTVNDSGVPFFRRLPLIGKFFDNIDHSYQETELLVIVTPLIVDPLKSDLQSIEEKELIEEATQFHPVEFVPDPQRDAVKKFIEESGLTLSERIKELHKREIVAVDIRGPREFESLEELEAKLQWTRKENHSVPAQAEPAAQLEEPQAYPAGEDSTAAREVADSTGTESASRPRHAPEPESRVVREEPPTAAGSLHALEELEEIINGI